MCATFTPHNNMSMNLDCFGAMPIHFIIKLAVHAKL